MKKGLLLLMAGFMAFGVAVQSLASARIDSMATDPRLIEDYDLIWLYPNKVLEYKGTADFRLNSGPFSGAYPQNGGFGGGTNEWGGLLIDEADLGGVVGVYVNRPNRLYTAAHGIAAGGFSQQLRYYWDRIGGSYVQNGDSPWNIVDIFFGTGMDGADLGIHLNYGDNGIGGTERSVIGLALGLGFKDMGPFNEGNLHLSYSMYDWTQVNAATPNADNGIWSANFGGLFSADAGNDTAIRLSGDVRYDSIDETDEYGAGNAVKVIDALLGLSCNHKVNGGKGLISSGLLIDWQGGNTDVTGNGWNAWTIVWSGSVEASVTNWLTIRAGIEKPLVARGYNEPSAYYDTVGNEVVFTTGLGVTWQNFTIDGVINIGSLENWLSSPNAGGGIFYPGAAGGNGIVSLSEIDMKYKF